MEIGRVGNEMKYSLDRIKLQIVQQNAYDGGLIY